MQSISAAFFPVGVKSVRGDLLQLSTSIDLNFVFPPFWILKTVKITLEFLQQTTRETDLQRWLAPKNLISKEEDESDSPFKMWLNILSNFLFDFLIEHFCHCEV